MGRACTDTAYLDDGRTLGIRAWDGDGMTAVLLHGLLDCAIGWEPLAERTPRSCVAVDLPGFAASSPPVRPRLSSYARDVLEALDELGVERFLLVGHSLGGGVATSMAEQAPERVAGLVLMAPVGFGRIPLADALTVPGVAQAIRLGFPLAMRSRLSAVGIYKALVANGNAPDPELLARLRSRASRAAPGAWAANQAIVAAGASKNAFHRRRVDYEGPVDALWGQADRLVPEGHARHVRRSLPQTVLSRWRGMGHHPQRERPEALAEYLERAWVRELRAWRAAAPRDRARAATSA